MTLQRLARVWAPRLTRHVLTLTTVILLITSAGCSSDHTLAPVAPGSLIEVIGTLVAVKDDRPLDGGVDLTLVTTQGVRVLARVPSAFIGTPRDSVLAMHLVVNASKLGDRLRARGTRDESGALRVKVLELLP